MKYLGWGEVYLSLKIVKKQAFNYTFLEMKSN